MWLLALPLNPRTQMRLFVMLSFKVSSLLSCLYVQKAFFGCSTVLQEGNLYFLQGRGVGWGEKGPFRPPTPSDQRRDGFTLQFYPPGRRKRGCFPASTSKRHVCCGFLQAGFKCCRLFIYRIDKAARLHRNFAQRGIREVLWEKDK